MSIANSKIYQSAWAAAVSCEDKPRPSIILLAISTPHISYILWTRMKTIFRHH